MRLHCVLAVTTLASAAAVVSARPLDGIYSDIRPTDEGHEGAEVVVTSTSKNRYWAVVRCADYTVGKPVRLLATVSGSQIEIEVDPSGQNRCPAGKFVGSFSRSGLTGKFQDMSQLPSSWPVHKLQKKVAAWQ